MTHDYWIGDKVLIISLQREGIFEGDNGEQAIVRLDGKKQIFPFSDISLVAEEDEDLPLEELGIRTSTPIKVPADIPDTIDLHLEVLNPKLIHSDPVLILAHQRVRLKDFLDRVSEYKVSPVTIIHGKGEGVLKAMALELLDDYKVRITPLNEGALEVRFLL